MAKPSKIRTGKSGPPDPGNFDAFSDWLEKQPREWSVTIAARVALRVLPLARTSENPASLILSTFRATAIARFAAKYPNRATASAASAAASAVTSVGSFPVTSAVEAVTDAAYAASVSAAVVKAAIDAGAAAASAASADDHANAATKSDAERLHRKELTAVELARDPLWPGLPPPRIGGMWQGLVQQLSTQAAHWSVWIDWYDDVVSGAAHDEAEDAAFTDIPDELPWDDGAEAVNTEIARRLRMLRESGAFEPAVPVSRLDSETKKTRTIARLAEVTSPQPSITDTGQLDAGPNQPFDVPTVADDLSTLPIRQRNIIKGILRDLPANAPRHLKDFLRSYDDELKARGAQPILGLLKDGADIIAAAVGAPRAADEWLEPGIRKAFDRFGENHILFVEHFPLDAEREAVYARTLLDEGGATGKKLVEPFEGVARAVREAHKVGAATDDFLMAVDKMTELARVLSTQPPPPPSDLKRSAPDEIKVSSEDRIQPVSVKKRAILGSLGFFERTYNLAGSTVTIAGYAGIAEALRPAIEMLSRFLR